MRASEALEKLIGLQIVAAGHAADLRGFGFGAISTEIGQRDAEWWLHIQCSWRLESSDKVITGKRDWCEPAAETDLPETDNWDPANGGSLQERRVRDLFRDPANSQRELLNYSELLVVERAESNEYGDVVIRFKGDFRLRIFPDGSSGEFWRIFRKGDLGSHYVWEADAANL